MKVMKIKTSRQIRKMIKIKMIASSDLITSMISVINISVVKRLMLSKTCLV